MTARYGMCLVIASLALGLGCGDSKDNADAAVAIDAADLTGRLGLAWSITDGTNALTCDDVGNSVSLRVTATPTIGGFAEVDAITCNTAMGSTRPLRVGTVNVSIELRGTSGALAAPVNLRDVVITSGQTTQLDPIVFTVNPTGNFTFNLSTAATGNNCDSPPTGGGVSEVSMELRDKAGTCVPTTFAIGAGGVQPAGTYTTTCPAGAPFSIAAGCGVEKDQTITVTGTRSGSKTMVISANQGPLQCWKRNPQFIVPANDLTLALGTQAMTLDLAVPGCDPNAVDAGVPMDAGATDANTMDAP